MVKVFVPTMLQSATGGVKEVEVEARNVRQVIERLDEMFPGIAGRLFSALADAGVNVRMIDQGSGEMNIIVGVHSDQFERAVQAIYDCFVRGGAAQV